MLTRVEEWQAWEKDISEALWQDSGQARHEFNLIDPVWPSMIYALCLKKAKMYLEKSWIARNFDIQHTLIYFHNHLPHSMPIFMCMIQHLHNQSLRVWFLLPANTGRKKLEESIMSSKLP